jgi:hypothetical protein
MVYEQIRNWLKAVSLRLPASAALLQQSVSLVSLRSPQQEERIMAKGAMKAGKEARKPKKDAKKPAPAPVLKAPPVKAMRIKEK